MAEEALSRTSDTSEEVVVSEVAPTPSADVTRVQEEQVTRLNLGSALAAEAAAEDEEGKETEAKSKSKKAVTIFQAVSFQEEADLHDRERKALDELKRLLQVAFAKNELFPPLPHLAAPKVAVTEAVTVGEAETTLNEDKAVPVPDEAKNSLPEEAETMAEESEALQEPVAPPSAATDDDGVKTVEAIEETVVPVASPAATDTATPLATTKEVPSRSDPAAAKEKVLIWGVPLLGDERSDTVLLKFLRARDLRAKEAMAMIKDAIHWRRTFGIEALLEEDLGVPELEKAVFMHGVDREGHPVCYNVYGELRTDEKLYRLAFAGEAERKRFLTWRIQYLEKSIRELLDFRPGGVSAVVQVTDLKNSAWLAKKELRQALDLLQDNYPEFAAKQIFINVPWWYLAVNRMMSTFLTQRTRSKFVFAGPSKSAETLFKYIAPESVPIQFGGFSKAKDSDFITADAVTEINLKPSGKQAIEIPVTEPSLLVWELRVLGWDVTYGAEFVPSYEDGYTVIAQKARKLVATHEPVLKGNFKSVESGKVVITVDNSTSKRKILLYRFKIKKST